MNTKLANAVQTIIDEAQRIGIEAFGDDLSAIGDDLSTGERAADLYVESVIDGIRWGARASVSVELAGGAMLRVVLPNGKRITHEWTRHTDADPLIKAALAAVTAARQST